MLRLILLLTALLAATLASAAPHPSPHPSPPALSCSLRRRSQAVYTSYIHHAMNRTRQIYGVKPAPTTFTSYADMQAQMATRPGSVLIIAYDRWGLAERDMVWAWASADYSNEITATLLSGGWIGPSPQETGGGGRAKRDNATDGGADEPPVVKKPWHDGAPDGFGVWLPCSDGHPCDSDNDCAMFNCESCDQMGPDDMGTCYGDLPH